MTNLRVTFKNENKSSEKQLEKAGLESWKNLDQDLRVFLGIDTEIETIKEYVDDLEYELEQGDQVYDSDDSYHELDNHFVNMINEKLSQQFSNYGLSFDRMENDQGTYYRYQIFWGGPSAEIRFHYNITKYGYKVFFIEFVYMNWFCGIGFDITKDHTAKELLRYFKELDMINLERDKM